MTQHFEIDVTPASPSGSGTRKTARRAGGITILPDASQSRPSRTISTASPNAMRRRASPGPISWPPRLWTCASPSLTVAAHEAISGSRPVRPSGPPNPDPRGAFPLNAAAQSGQLLDPAEHAAHQRSRMRPVWPLHPCLTVHEAEPVPLVQEDDVPWVLQLRHILALRRLRNLHPEAQHIAAPFGIRGRTLQRKGIPDVVADDRRLIIEQHGIKSLSVKLHDDSLHVRLPLLDPTPSPTAVAERCASPLPTAIGRPSWRILSDRPRCGRSRRPSSARSPTRTARRHRQWQSLWPPAGRQYPQAPGTRRGSPCQTPTSRRRVRTRSRYWCGTYLRTTSRV